MTKEEYLNMYKEDKLAEICAQLDSKSHKFIAQIAELGDCVGELKKKCEELDIWDDTEKIFRKLTSIPAKDFIKLYYMMQGMMNNSCRYENVSVPDPNNWGCITTAYN